ncbi:MAG TPA: hypothetical protein VF807_10175, partial [Ktedonobacterales bacterium]
VRCHVPMPSDTAAHSPRLCHACERDVTHCVACAQPVLGTVYTLADPVTGVSRSFCAECMETRQRCDLCLAPVVSSASPIKDGQWRCATCAHEMVLDPRHVAEVYSEALGWFELLLGAGLATLPELRISGRNALEEVRARHEAGSVGAPSAHTLGFYVRDGLSSTIYVRYGLPASLLLGTLAHELGHAWEAERARGLRDPVLIEGFAEWVAYHVLLAAGQRDAAIRATRREDHYGEGLRACLKLERDVGRATMLRQIQRARG